MLVAQLSDVVITGMFGLGLAVVSTAGAIVVAFVARSDRERLSHLEAAAEDCAKRERRHKKALIALGQDPDDFDDE